MPSREHDRIAPGLLIAMPQLADPNFKRAVVLMLEHNEEGSFGIVVNNPISAAVTLDVEGSEPIPIVKNVYLGGPVGPNLCMVVHGSQWHCDRTHDIVDGLSVTEPSSAIPHLVTQDVVPFRFVMGYSGWGPGQLSTELARGAWLCCPVTAELVLQSEPSQQWQHVIRSLGIDPLMLVPSSTTQ
jgi:putative transcriptional regulator